MAVHVPRPEKADGRLAPSSNVDGQTHTTRRSSLTLLSSEVKP
jgi:hypothetical protein